MKKIFSSQFFLLILLVIFILVSFFLVKAYFRDYEIRQEIRELEKKQQDLEKNKINSLEMLKYVSSDLYVEDQARLELNMMEEGEKVVYLDTLIKEKEELEFDYLDLKEDEKIANYKKWWYYIRNK